MTTQPVVRVTSDNLKSLSPEMLASDKWWAQIQDLIYDIDASKEPDRAKRALVDLSSILQGVSSADPRLLERYAPALVALRLMSLLLVKDAEKERFLKDNLATVFLQDYADPKYWLRFLFAYYDFDPEISTGFKRQFLRAFESCENEFGGKQIKTLLTEYIASPAMQAQRGLMDEANFVNSSSKTRPLSQEEKTALRSLLRVYDWIRFEIKIAEPALKARGPVGFIPASAPRYPVFPPQGTVTREPEARAPVARPQPVIPIRTIPPVELRDRSTEGHRVLPPPPRPKFIPRPVAPPAFGSKTGGGQQGAAGQKSAVDEDLYRSTLEELQKMRMDYEKASSRPISAMPSRKIPVPAAPPPDIPVSIKPPAQVQPSADLFQPFSVNEAVARGAPDFQQAGQGQTGLTPGKIIEEKLKKLKNETL